MARNFTDKLNNHKIEFEADLLLKTINQNYGYDFSDYSRDCLIRRLDELRQQFQLKHISDMIPLILWDESFFHSFLNKLTIGVTEFFRDPEFFISFKKNILPYLTTFPYVKLWHAGCSTGEEVYSMAMLLKSCNFLDNSVLYGTDINNDALQTAIDGIYSLDAFNSHSESYKAITGEDEFSNIYCANNNHAKITHSIQSKITFSHHNLVSDSAFGEMNVILCRNVLIYFNHDLQNQVLDLLNKSLRHGGYLCLGRGESLYFSVIQDFYEPIDLKQRIYRKKIQNSSGSI